MFSGPLLSTRRAREAEQLLAAAEDLAHLSPRARLVLEARRPPSSAAGSVQGSVAGSAPTSPRTVTAPPSPLAPAPSSPFPPVPPSVRAPSMSLGGARSLERESSSTPGPLLDSLLPLLSPASGGPANAAAAQPHIGVAGDGAGLTWPCAYPPAKAAAASVTSAAARPALPRSAGCAAGLAKTMLGVGLVAVPHAFLLLGGLPAAAAFAAVAAAMHTSCACLAAGAQRAVSSGEVPPHRLSYSAVLAALLSPWAAAALDFAMLVNTAGAGCGLGCCLHTCTRLWCMLVAGVLMGAALPSARCPQLLSPAPFFPGPGMQVSYLIAAADVVTSDEEWRQLGTPAWLQSLLASRPATLALLCMLVLGPLLSAR